MKTIFRALCLAALTAAPLVAQVSSFKVPEIPYERYKLSNGLTVLLSRDTTAAVVTVDVWYHVGSKNEDVGRTGFAHLFEHVMFQGSQHIPYGQHFKIVENAGGDLNGTTNNDRTNYFETLPSNQLETALWLESDRMGFLLEGLDITKLDAQRDVVKNERRQRIDNQPYGSMWEVVSASMFPSTNPYSWPVIGSMADLSSATLDDVKNFFKKFYAPNNATLAVVGDIDIAKTKALIEKYYGAIAAGPAIVRPVVAPVTLQAEQRLVLEDARAQLPQILITWPTVGVKDSDNAALNALSNILTQDRTSRLTKLLVYDRQLATQVYAGQNDYEDGGMFLVFVAPRPGASLTEIERLVDSTLNALNTNPPTEAEVERFKTSTRVQSVLGLDGSMNRAEILLDGQVMYGNPLHYVTSTNASLAIKPADLSRVVSKYLTKGRVVLSMVPAGKLDEVAQPKTPYKNVTPAPEAQDDSSASDED